MDIQQILSAAKEKARDCADAAAKFFDEKVRPVYTDKIKPFYNDKVVPFFKDPKKSAAVSAAAVLAVAAAVCIPLYFNVWSWVDNITLTMPSDVFAASQFTASASDVSDSDVSSSDASVSASDVLSPTDAAVTLRMKKGLTVADALDQANVVLDASLSVEPSPETPVTADMVITVYRLKYVTVACDGARISVYTEADTVGQLLSDEGITVGADDRMTCSASDALVNNMEITVYRVTYSDEVKSEPIPYTTEKRENGDMLSGKKKTVTEGKNGEKAVTYRSTYVDGVLESVDVVGEEIVAEPVTEIIEVGTKKTTTTTKKTTKKTTKPGRYVVSKEKVYDCDGSGHGYYIITYSDGTVEYKDF